MPGFNNGKIPEAPIQNLTAQIALEVEETTEEFIFKTIWPFCQEVTQRVVSKKDLEQALIHYFPKRRIVKNGERVKYYECPTCGGDIRKDQQFCDECGQRLEVP